MSQLHFETAGQGAPLILLHGMGGGIRHWRPMIERLAPHYEVFAVDALGHGASPKPEVRYDLDTITASLADWWLAKRGGPVHVAGLSAGGAVALRWAELEPYTVRSITAVAPGGLGLPADIGMKMAALPVVGPLLYGGDEDSVRRFWGRATYRSGVLTEEFIQAEMAAAIHPEDRGVLFSMLRNFPATALNMVRNLHRITCPTLVLWGAQDAILPPAQASVITSAVKGSRSILVDKCGHIMPWEQPQRLQDEMLAFLGGQAKGPQPPAEKQYLI